MNKSATAIDHKCAPGKTYEAGSCIALHILVGMVDAFNKSSPPRFHIKLDETEETLHPHSYKKYLLRELESRLSNVCSDQVCWTERPFLQAMEESSLKELQKYTFMPKGPTGKFEWLSNLDIDAVLKQYAAAHADKFRYLGAVAVDFEEYDSPAKGVDYAQLLADGVQSIGMVINLDDHTGEGSHWVALYARLQQQPCVLYFDSVGTKPPKRIRKYMQFLRKLIENHHGKRVTCQCRHNKIQHQFEDCDCGVYAINFIVNMLQDVDFTEYCQQKISDQAMNDKRNEYFSQIYTDNPNATCPKPNNHENN